MSIYDLFKFEMANNWPINLYVPKSKITESLLLNQLINCVDDCYSIDTILMAVLA